MAVTNFIWDELSDNVLLETDETDALTARYTNRPEQFGKLISQYRIEDEKVVERFYHYDGESSTRDLTDSDETVTDTVIYTAYGEEVARTGTTTNPFGYKGAVGYYTNAETSDIYVRARTYEPAMGCWLSADPLGSVDGPNLFHAYFVPNSTDPSGEQIIVIPQSADWPEDGCFSDRSITRWITLQDPWVPLGGIPKGTNVENCFFVQHIEVTCAFGDCEGCSCTPRARPSAHYLEAAQIYRFPGFSGYGTKDRHRFRLAASRDCGRLKATAEVKLFWDPEIAESIRTSWIEGTNDIESPCGLLTAGPYSNPIPPPQFPPWWSMGALAGPSVYWASLKWDCCLQGPGAGYVTPDASPRNW